MEYNCNNCGIPVKRRPSELKKSKSGSVYCSKSCSNSKNNSLHRKGANNPNYKTGVSSYRKRGLLNSDLKCADCGIDNPVVLQVHHVDRNKKNNRDGNLKVLCANCHLIEHSK